MNSSPARPDVQPPGLWHFPTPAHAQLSNGIDVVTYQLPGQYVISAQLVFGVPLNAEDPALEGVATVCARSLDEGTRTHPGEQFAEHLENEGAGFGVELTLAGMQTVLDVPITRLDQALPLFAEAVIEPVLSDEDVTRHVQLRLAEIEQAEANSASVASKTFRQTIFHAASRASRPNGGEADTVKQVTSEAVRQFHLDHVGPHQATLILAGDFADDPVALAESCLGGWTNEHQTSTAFQAPQAAPVRSRIVDRPGAVQADVRLGGFGIDRTDPRWADVTVASYAMGGAFLSRLNSVLREEKGYTYGVSLQFSPQRTGGSYAVQGSFRTDVVADAISLARDLLQVDQAPFTSDEVVDAVNFFTGVSPLRYATADGVAGQAATQLQLGLPETYVDRNLIALTEVTPESATEAYRSLVDVDRLSLVVAGDAERLADPLRSLGFPL